MIKNIFYLCFVYSLLLTLGSCQKEYNPLDPNLPPPGGTTPGGTTPPANTGSFTAKIDGAAFVANKFAGAVRTRGLINVSGLANDGKIITMTLTDSGVHTYQLTQTTINAGAYNETANGISFTSNGSANTAEAGGTVTITSIDTVKKTMTGTFNFKAFRASDNTTRNITTGIFTGITYTTDALPPTTNTTDTFRVKRDGVAWTNYSVIGVAVPFLNQIAVTSSTDASATVNVGLTFPNTVTPGSYAFDFITYAAVYNPSADPMMSMTAFGGNLTILEHNTTTKRVRGTFNFNASPLTNPSTVVAFTEGYFSVKYQ